VTSKRFQVTSFKLLVLCNNSEITPKLSTVSTVSAVSIVLLKHLAQVKKPFSPPTGMVTSKILEQSWESG
jgi:hypothetical protein